MRHTSRMEEMSITSPPEPEDPIAAVRRFNRLFTRRIGLLQEGLLHSPYTLTEARLLYEIATQPQVTAARLGRELGLDAGYLSRILARLEQRGLLARERAADDARRRSLRLTPEGQEAFTLLDSRSREEIAEMLAEVAEDDRRRLLAAMGTIETILDKGLKYSEPFFLRTHGPGDMGWVTHRHGVLYAQEYGWDERFEALVAQIVADFVTNYDPRRERCWIAERNEDIVGSVFVVRSSDEERTAKLRLLLVEPGARGLGLGSRLVEECVRFARRSGYEKISLWTNSVLKEARHLYEKAGFRLIKQEPHHSFGQDLVGEHWERIL